MVWHQGCGSGSEKEKIDGKMYLGGEWVALTDWPVMRNELDCNVQLCRPWAAQFPTGGIWTPTLIGTGLFLSNQDTVETSNSSRGRKNYSQRGKQFQTRCGGCLWKTPPLNSWNKKLNLWFTLGVHSTACGAVSLSGAGTWSYMRCWEVWRSGMGTLTGGRV